MTPCSPLPAPPGLPGDAALFLDFDGTLAPIQDDPDSVALPETGAHVLCLLKAKLDGALTIISGRGIGDLSRRTPVGLWRIGGHGLDVCAPGNTPEKTAQDAPGDLVQTLTCIETTTPGARLEHKGAVLAMHYRAAPDIGAKLLAMMTEKLVAWPDYRLQHGKMVIEAKPAAANKGKAIKAMLGKKPFANRIPIMVGDDVTDEDAMAVVSEHGGWSIKVGAGDTVAQYRLPDTSAVWKWLEGQTG